MAIQWGVQPPQKVLRAEIRLLCLRAGQEVAVAILGPALGVATHWVEGRSKPCQGSERCQFHDRPATWKGFVPVICDGWSPHGPRKGRWTWVLVVTEEIGADATAWERGTLWLVSRPGTKSNGPLHCSPLLTKFRGELPETFDVRPYVLRAAGMDLSTPLRILRSG